MVGTDQNRSAGDFVLYIVAEPKRRAAANDATVAQDAKVGVEGEFAQRDDHAKVHKLVDLALEILAAILELR